MCLVNKRMNDWWVNISYSDYDQIQIKLETQKEETKSQRT